MATQYGRIAAKYPLWQCQQVLARLQADHVDYIQCLYNIHSTRMSDYIMELHGRVPAHLFSYNKQLHVNGKMNICHPHISTSDLRVYRSVVRMVSGGASIKGPTI